MRTFLLKRCMKDFFIYIFAVMLLSQNSGVCAILTDVHSEGAHPGAEEGQPVSSNCSATWYD